jgi:putative CRISPR-associated protein (TIGR02619 family)
VGTSLFERYGESNDDFAREYSYLRDQPAAAWPNNACRIDSIRNKLLAWARVDEKTSAETKSLLKIQEKAGTPIDTRLIATETVASRLAAEILYPLLGGKINASFEPERDVIKGLQIADRKRFEREGLVNLVTRIEELRSDETEVCINITGGYKGVIPYLTIMGQVHGLPLYYIFEDTTELIRIPQAPISINWGLFEKYSHILQDLANGITDWSDYKRKNSLNDEYDDFQACIWQDGEFAELNAIGRMFWEKYQDSFLVKIHKASPYATDDRGNKREVQEALTELYKRLMIEISENELKSTDELHNHILKLGDQNDLRHGKNPASGKPVYIFKSTRRSHIRMLYTPEIALSGELSIRLIDYVRGDFDHQTYIAEFEHRLNLLTVWEHTDVPLRKP